MTRELLNQLQKAIAAYEASITEPHMGTVACKNATEALQGCFREADRLLKEELDVLVVVRGTDLAFFDRYWNAWTIGDRRGGRSNGGKEENPKQAA